ncbi:MAG TPA: MotA/TolQ/ExbB proton channel family protein [Phycisphaerae bacterium]|nr:MotA/TolQ/ExbB proton channel family protein [Phycisphaerae bacterium]
MTRFFGTGAVAAMWFLAQAATLVAADGSAGAGSVQVSYFTRFIVGGGWITWFILLPLSVATMALLIVYALTVRRAAMLPDSVRQHMSELTRGRQYRALAEFAAAQPSMIAQVVRAGLAEAAQGQPNVQRALDEATELQSSRYLRRIEWLNLIGNISPMIGLFGTVTGMIQAFYELVEISAAGGVTNAAQLADAISLALVTTFWGLAIAIPALAAFAILRNRVDALAADCWLVADQLLEGVGKSGQTASGSSAGGGAAAVEPR